MRTFSRYLLIALSLSGCGMTTRTDSVANDGASAKPSATTAGLSGRAAFDATMRAHAERGQLLRDAVLRGDLQAAKQRASSLAQLRFEPNNASWNQKVEVMDVAAASVAQARDLSAAARALASLATSCGNCHEAHEGPSPPQSTPVEDDGGVRSAMLRHEWAATRLWDGLATPSDAAWAQGALALSDPSLAPELLTPGKTPVPKVGQFAEAIRALGLQAQKATTVDARRAIYADTLTSCANCHAWLGGGPP